jgi:hypothetical protein
VRAHPGFLADKPKEGHVKKLALMMAFLFVAALAVKGLAHPGALDADGGHWEKATNTYHWHQDADGNKFNTPVEGGKDHKPGQKAPVKAAEWNKTHAAPAAKASKAAKKGDKAAAAPAAASQVKDGASVQATPTKAEKKAAKKAAKQAKKSAKADAAGNSGSAQK